MKFIGVWRNLILWLGIGISGQALSASLVPIYDSFEVGASALWQIQTAYQSNLLAIDFPTPRSGTRVLKVTLDKADPWVAEGPRSEIYRPNNTAYWAQGSNVWVGGSILFPDNYVDDPAKEIVWQIHGVDTVPFLIQSVGENLIVRGKNFADKAILKTKGQWMDIVVHHNFSPTNGTTEVYVNGIRIINATTGATMTAGERHYQKFGLYKSGWKESNSIVNSRVLYFDEIRFGTSYAKVKPR